MRSIIHRSATNLGSMRILQVNTYDIGGGAEAVARNLHRVYRDSGHISWLAVGSKIDTASSVLLIPNDPYRKRWAKTWIAIGNLTSHLIGKIRGVSLLRTILQIYIGQPGRVWNSWQGKEDFDFPGTWRLLAMPTERPDVVHCHNLHGNWPNSVYFDLCFLPTLSQQVPVVLTLHDAWMITGHCAHSFKCERWKKGCGNCPDLTIPPAAYADATRYNWRRKRDVYARSRLYVVTPSQWLMDKVEESILLPGVVQKKVIPNGVDLSIFHPEDKATARASVGIMGDIKVLLFAANGIRRNVWKDYQTIREAIKIVSNKLISKPLLFIGLGDKLPTEHFGSSELRFVPFQKDLKTVASYYQGADIYVHASKADTFPNAVLEALACGTPVVATAVGGISEQLSSAHVPASVTNLNRQTNSPTGVLVPERDPSAMAAAIEVLLREETLRQSLAENAAAYSRRHFDLKQQAHAYLDLYEQAIENKLLNASIIR